MDVKKLRKYVRSSKRFSEKDLLILNILQLITCLVELGINSGPIICSPCLGKLIGILLIIIMSIRKEGNE
jgi:hypothetical protein